MRLAVNLTRDIALLSHRSLTPLGAIRAGVVIGADIRLSSESLKSRRDRTG
ncbi:hypothetical protein [Enterobacter sp. RHBSTW-01064]|uniref:hypothetical protein n=1 Tax=Enterobacter sp. RHBSTW-01064 TaxID=2742679 RepID=UPI002016BD05|nr:hypothetical protein [Enterobacter sp. RHBSTW-01064]